MFIPKMTYRFNLSFSFSLLLMGFLLANIFGILTNNKSIIFLFVLCIEIINSLIYSKPSSQKIKVRALRAVDAKRSPFFSIPVFFLYQPFRKLNNLYDKNQNTILPELPKKKQSSLRSSGFFLWNAAKSKPLSFLCFNQRKKVPIIISFFISSLNFLKIGFEFGFFVDAFKLGS